MGSEGSSYSPTAHWADWWQNQDLNPRPTLTRILFSLGRRTPSIRARMSLQAALREAPAVKTGGEIPV